MDYLCVCLPSKSELKSQTITTLANFVATAGDCTASRGLLVAQALLQLTAKLAQQADSLPPVNMPWHTAHCIASQTGYCKRPVFTDSTALLKPAYLWLLLAAVQQTCPPADLGKRKVRFKLCSQRYGQYLLHWSHLLTHSMVY